MDEMSDLEMVMYAVDASPFTHLGFELLFDCSKLKDEIKVMFDPFLFSCTDNCAP